MINKTELGDNDFSSLDKLQEETSGATPELMNPNIASLEVKGQQYNELSELARMAGIDKAGLLADPASAPSVKANTQLNAINQKNPTLGQHLAKPDKQLMWWDKIDAIFKAKPEAFKGVPSFEDLGLPITPSVIYLGESQTTRGLGMADFISQQAQEFNKWLSTGDKTYSARQAQVQAGKPAYAVNPVTKLTEQNKLAAEALYKLARLGNGDLYGNSEGNVIAQQALAAIKSSEVKE
jgi:hypothetical protein